MKINKVAAIDIGSNAVRLLISRLKEQPEGITLKKELMIRIPLRLGEDSFETGEISKQRANRLLKVMKSFHYLMQVYQVDVYRAYATASYAASFYNLCLFTHFPFLEFFNKCIPYLFAS